MASGSLCLQKHPPGMDHEPPRAPPSVWESMAVSYRLSGTSEKQRSSSERRAQAQGRTALKRSGCLPQGRKGICNMLVLPCLVSSATLPSCCGFSVFARNLVPTPYLQPSRESELWGLVGTAKGSRASVFFQDWPGPFWKVVLHICKPSVLDYCTARRSSTDGFDGIEAKTLGGQGSLSSFPGDFQPESA